MVRDHGVNEFDIAKRLKCTRGRKEGTATLASFWDILYLGFSDRGERISVPHIFSMEEERMHINQFAWTRGKIGKDITDRDCGDSRGSARAVGATLPTR